MTAVRNIELSAPLAGLDDLGAAASCMLVFRWRGRIVGQTIAPVQGGTIPDLPRVVSAAVPLEAIYVWLRDTLGFDERGYAPDRLPGATVAICTRERPDDLRRALAAVSMLSGADHDVLVVDNAPRTDRTRAVAGEFPRVRYVREDTPGLNAARNCALRTARHDIVAFTDDDAAPEPGWLQALRLNFGDRRTLAVTGLTLPGELETPAQELFEQHCPFGRGFVRRVFDGQRDNPLAAGGIGAGVNMAVRRRMVERLGGFDERLDGGTPTMSGGDHDLFIRILTAGYRIVYDPAAVSWHRHRRTDSEMKRAVRGYGVGVYATWTKLLLEQREVGVLRLAWSWFRREQLPLALGRGRAKTDPRRAALAREELRGCLRGAPAWFRSKRTRAPSS